MNDKIIQSLVSIAVLGTTGLFIWQNHQREVKTRVNYDGEDIAIARPVNLADTQYKFCNTKRVSDGDTISVDCDGEELKLRFCGIDAPESNQPLGQESKSLMAKLVDGKEVFVRPIEKDRYGRTVAQVEVKGDRKMPDGQHEILFVNAEMVRAGLAYEYKQYSANCPNKDLIIKAEAIAKDKKLGVWSGNYEKPWDYRKRTKK